MVICNILVSKNTRYFTQSCTLVSVPWRQLSELKEIAKTTLVLQLWKLPSRHCDFAQAKVQSWGMQGTVLGERAMRFCSIWTTSWEEEVPSCFLFSSSLNGEMEVFLLLSSPTSLSDYTMLVAEVASMSEEPDSKGSQVCLLYFT